MASADLAVDTFLFADFLVIGPSLYSAWNHAMDPPCLDDHPCRRSPLQLPCRLSRELARMASTQTFHRELTSRFLAQGAPLTCPLLKMMADTAQLVSFERERSANGDWFPAHKCSHVVLQCFLAGVVRPRGLHARCVYCR